MINLNFKITTIDLNLGREITIAENIQMSFSDDIKFSEVIKIIKEKYGAKRIFLEFISRILWSEFFDQEICQQINNDEFLNLSLKELEKQFLVSNKILYIIVDPEGIGASIACVEGIKIFFHVNEKDLHHTPHIHCAYSGEEFRVNLINNLPMKNDKTFKNKRKTETAINFIRNHNSELLNYWHRVVINGESLKLKIEI